MEKDIQDWFYSLKDFIIHILYEDDEEYIARCMSAFFNQSPHCALQNIEDSMVVLGWLRQFQKFKCSYALYPNKLNNLLIIAVYMHCRNIETAEYIIRGHLYRNGHTIFSEILKKKITIDGKFIERVNQFYRVWHDDKR